MKMTITWQVETTGGEWLYQMVLTEEKLKGLKAYSFIKRVEIIKANDEGTTIPNSSRLSRLS